MSQQTDFLDTAIKDGIDQAKAAHPGAVSDEEANALKSLSVDDLKRLKSIREAIEAGSNVAAADGNGVLSF